MSSTATWRALLSSGITSNMEFRGSKPDSVIGQQLVEDRLRGRTAGRRSAHVSAMMRVSSAMNSVGQVMCGLWLASIS